jgi:hypothetical protein
VVLRQVSEMLAASIRETLHHAEWRITADPDVVRRYGDGDRCPTCLAGLDQALARLVEHPDDELLVGTLHWTTPPRGEA